MTPTAALAGVLTGHRTVYTALGHPTPASLARRRWDARLFRTVVRRVRAPLAYSASAADSIEEVTGVLPRVMPPGIRTDRFPVAPAPPVADRPVLLFPAFAADRRKRLDLLLAAMPAVLTRYPNARVRLVGGGDADWAFALLPAADRDRVRRACDDVGVVELDDMPGHYATSTVTVLPSVEEAFGIVLIESLSSGRPVVALAEGGPTEIVDRPDVGSLVPRDAPDRLAAAILDTIRSAGLPQTAATCHAHARRWGWVEHVGPAHLELYREVARRWP
jgi:phosphatidylinositol alpha-mannosyltransferase